MSAHRPPPGQLPKPRRAGVELGDGSMEQDRQVSSPATCALKHGQMTSRGVDGKVGKHCVRVDDPQSHGAGLVSAVYDGYSFLSVVTNNDSIVHHLDVESLRFTDVDFGRNASDFGPIRAVRLPDDYQARLRDQSREVAALGIVADGSPCAAEQNAGVASGLDASEIDGDFDALVWR
jgi:hypothetical protein